MIDPAEQALYDQFGAHLRDHCRKMLKVAAAMEWENFSLRIRDPRPEDDDVWEITYASGEFWLSNFSVDPEEAFELDLKRLGV